MASPFTSICSDKNEAVGLIGGGSGMIDVMLSQKVSEVTFS